jgi:hypothetical protein
MKEREINQREIERLERKENEIEMDYYDGKLSEEKKDALIKLTIEQRTAKEERNLDLDKKLDAIIKAEKTKLALEKFQVDFETNLENARGSPRGVYRGYYRFFATESEYQVTVRPIKGTRKRGSGRT